jgi:hypothetical protein
LLVKAAAKSGRSTLFFAPSVFALRLRLNNVEQDEFPAKAQNEIERRKANQDVTDQPNIRADESELSFSRSWL